MIKKREVVKCAAGIRKYGIYLDCRIDHYVAFDNFPIQWKKTGLLEALLTPTHPPTIKQTLTDWYRSLPKG